MALKEISRQSADYCSFIEHGPLVAWTYNNAELFHYYLDEKMNGKESDCSRSGTKCIPSSTG